MWGGKGTHIYKVIYHMSSFTNIISSSNLLISSPNLLDDPVRQCKTHFSAQQVIFSKIGDLTYVEGFLCSQSLTGVI